MRRLIFSILIIAQVVSGVAAGAARMSAAPPGHCAMLHMDGSAMGNIGHADTMEMAGMAAGEASSGPQAECVDECAECAVCGIAAFGFAHEIALFRPPVYLPLRDVMALSQIYQRLLRPPIYS